MTNIPKELESIAEARRRFVEMAKEAHDTDADPEKVIAGLRGVMEACLDSGMPLHIRKGVRKAALASIEDGWGQLAEAAAEEVPEPTEEAAAPVNRIASVQAEIVAIPPGLKPAVTQPDGTLKTHNGGGISLRGLFSDLNREAMVQGFYPREEDPRDPNPAGIAKSYAFMMSKAQDGITYGDTFITRDQVAGFMDAVLDKWVPGLGRMVRTMAAPLPVVEKAASRPAMGPEPKPAAAPAAIRTPAPKPARPEAKEQTFPPRRISLKGSRPGSNPDEDGGLHEIQVIATPFGEIALTTGAGILKNPADPLNRDAVGARWDGKTVTLVSADGVGDEPDSDSAAQITVETLLDTPSLGQATKAVREALTDADLDRNAGACVTVARITRDTDGTYDIEFGQSGDTTLIITNNGDQDIVTLEQNEAQMQRDLESILRELAAIGENQNISDLAADFDVTQLEEADQQNLAYIQSKILKYGYEGWMLRAPHRLTNNMKGRKGSIIGDRLKGVRPGAIIIVGTDGVFDNFRADDVLERLPAFEKKLGRRATSAEIETFILEETVRIMKVAAYPAGKPDNIGLTVIRLT